MPILQATVGAIQTLMSPLHQKGLLFLPVKASQEPTKSVPSISKEDFLGSMLVSPGHSFEFLSQGKSDRSIKPAIQEISPAETPKHYNTEKFFTLKPCFHSWPPLKIQSSSVPP